MVTLPSLDKKDKDTNSVAISFKKDLNKTKKDEDEIKDKNEARKFKGFNISDEEKALNVMVEGIKPISSSFINNAVR